MGCGEREIGHPSLAPDLADPSQPTLTCTAADVHGIRFSARASIDMKKPQHPSRMQYRIVERTRAGGGGGQGGGEVIPALSWNPSPSTCELRW